jgi:cytochrome P450
MLRDSRYEETGKGLTTDETVNQVLMFYFGGNGPPAKVLTWAFYYLAKNPHVERKLHAELDQVLGGRQPGVEDMSRLRYTRMIIDEILRLNPTAWTTPRTSIGPDTIGPYRIPAKSSFFILLYTIHRHPDYWDDPERFDPERFHPDRADPRRNEAYFPFGLGQRSCIAGHFSIMEMQLVLATLAQKFRLRCDADLVVRPKIGFPLGPGGPVKMTVARRRGAAAAGA